MKHEVFEMKQMIFILFFLFSEVCVDKARIDEYEQRASELAQKASITTSIFIPLHIITWSQQNPPKNPTACWNLFKLVL